MSPEEITIQEMCDLNGNTYKVTDKYIYITLKDGNTRKIDTNLNFVADIQKYTASDNERIERAIEKLESIGENDIAEFAKDSFDLITKQQAEIADLKAQALKDAAKIAELEQLNSDLGQIIALQKKPLVVQDMDRIAKLEAALIEERAKNLNEWAFSHEINELYDRMEASVIKAERNESRKHAKEQLQAEGLIK
jgi:hypothetical protein